MPSAVRRPIQVFVIAPPVWWGLEHLLQSAHPRIDLVGMAPSVEQSLRALGQHGIDVLLLDLEGDDAAQSVRTLLTGTHAKLLVVTGSGNVAMLDQASGRVRTTRRGWPGRRRRRRIRCAVRRGYRLVRLASRQRTGVCRC